MVYVPHRSLTVWEEEYTTVLDAVKFMYGCHVHWRPHGVHQPKRSLQCNVTRESRGKPTFGCGVARAPQVLLGARGS